MLQGFITVMKQPVFELNTILSFMIIVGKKYLDIYIL